ncbi:MAG: A/G-specific adenine glycosylase [Brevundimonas sp.]|nr:A/G-specific adenine glycosylase [Brevundimonas sp.]
MSSPDSDRLAAIRQALMSWYGAHARALPWRMPPGSAARADPYRVWLSEVMLQQTTVPHATPYFEAFTTRWPTVEALAAAEDEAVMGAWAGLGYYARARNLLACARAVARDHGGVFPGTEEGLRALPGLGTYTAAAVAAIAFGRRAVVVDGNVERVLARLFTVETPLPKARPELRALADALTPEPEAFDPGDWAQALMDLGSRICRPRSPLCGECPLAGDCQARASGMPEAWPKKMAKVPKPRREGVVWVLVDGAGRVGLVKRPDKGLLGGMLALPTGGWDGDENVAEPVDAEWRNVGTVRHVFTHFELELIVMRAEGEADLIWREVAEARAALPTVFRKGLDRALAY